MKHRKCPLLNLTGMIACHSRRPKSWWGRRAAWMDWRLGHSHLSHSCGDCDGIQRLYQRTAVPRVTEQNWRRAQVLCDSSRRSEADISWWHCGRGYLPSKFLPQCSKISVPCLLNIILCLTTLYCVTGEIWWSVTSRWHSYSEQWPKSRWIVSDWWIRSCEERRAFWPNASLRWVSV